jgi:hypothetical protein
MRVLLGLLVSASDCIILHRIVVNENIAFSSNPGP